MDHDSNMSASSNSSSVFVNSIGIDIGAGLHLTLADLPKHIREAADKVLDPGIFTRGCIQFKPIHGPVIIQNLMPTRALD
jgi:hypothetical protein